MLHDNERNRRAAGKLQSASENVSDAIDAVKDLSLAKTLGAALPWAQVIGESAAESLPLIKFLAKLLEKVAGKATPDELAALACSVAYLQSIQQALAGSPNAGTIVEQTRIALSTLGSPEHVDYTSLTFGNISYHPFTRKAQETFHIYAKDAGIADGELTRLEIRIQDLYPRNLRRLLGASELREKLKPVVDMMHMEGDDLLAYDLLQRHEAYVREQFEQLPVLKTEPFALRDVYIDTDCGSLTWKDFHLGISGARTGNRFDQFNVADGGRHALLETVVSLLEQRHLDDAIVIQGVAGAGKSAFTLRLAVELMERGLHPIRIRLRDLNLDRHVMEALPRAIRTADPQMTAAKAPTSLDPFLGGRLFETAVTFGKATISPYVLILDGWDEISVAASEGFRQRVERMLQQIREEFLQNRDVKVRVILTGRPSVDVNETKFFRDWTPILTIRHLTPQQLKTFAGRVRDELHRKPLKTKDTWALPSDDVLAPVFERYEADFQLLEDPNKDAPPGPTEVLGLPLLAHIALRLFGVWTGGFDTLLSSPTTLLRSLVDITCDAEDEPATERLGVAGRYRIPAPSLRQMLRDVAIAITVVGQETITLVDLARRTGYAIDEMEKQAADAEAYPLTELMVNFFFKGGYRQLGCEFLHKSFREYLFAESLVEILKTFGQEQPKALVPLPKDGFWRDFDQSDPRWGLSERLMKAVAAQWISPEVDRHLRSLLEWEIARAAGKVAADRHGTPTDPIAIGQWEVVRDTLADLWEWWGEGIHLRPQPVVGKDDKIEFPPSRADRIVEWCAPPPARGSKIPRPPRTTTIDSHLGDALFRLNVLVHFQIAERTGWLEGETWSHGLRMERRYQLMDERGKQQWVLFSPSETHRLYFFNYCARINAAGWRPVGPFPLGLDCRGLDLSRATFTVPEVPATSSIGVVWDFSNMEDATVTFSFFWRHSFRSVRASGANFRHSQFFGADLTDAELTHAFLEGCSLIECTADRANLTNAVIRYTRWTNTSLSGAITEGAIPQDAFSNV